MANFSVGSFLAASGQLVLVGGGSLRETRRTRSEVLDKGLAIHFLEIWKNYHNYKNPEGLVLCAQTLQSKSPLALLITSKGYQEGVKRYFYQIQLAMMEEKEFF